MPNSECRIPVAAYGPFLAANRGRAQGGDDLVGARVGDFDEREPVGDFDRAQVARIDPRLARDRANQVAWSDARLAPGADEEAHDVVLCAARSGRLPAFALTTRRRVPCTSP